MRPHAAASDTAFVDIVRDFLTGHRALRRLAGRWREGRLEFTEVQALVAQALAAARSAALSGKQLTPFLLDHLNAASGGRTLEANKALIEANAALAAEIAKAYATPGHGSGGSAPR